MAALTNYAVQQINLEMKDGTGTIPSTYYAAAMKVMPGLDGTGGTEIDPGVDTWYARQAVTLDTPSLAGRSMANAAAIEWTASAGTTRSNWALLRLPLKLKSSPSIGVFHSSPRSKPSIVASPPLASEISAAEANCRMMSL